MIHFMGTCKYLLSKYNKQKSTCRYEVQVRNENRGKNKRVSFTKSVHVIVRGTKIDLLKKKKVQVTSHFFMRLLWLYTIRHNNIDNLLQLIWPPINQSKGLQVWQLEYYSHKSCAQFPKFLNSKLMANNRLFIFLLYQDIRIQASCQMGNTSISSQNINVINILSIL